MIISLLKSHTQIRLWQPIQIDSLDGPKYPIVHADEISLSVEMKTKYVQAQCSFFKWTLFRLNGSSVYSQKPRKI